MGRYITVDANGYICGTREGPSIAEGEIESAMGEAGQIRQADGSFVTPEITPKPAALTLGTAENQIIIMDVLATIYEEMLAKGTV